MPEFNRSSVIQLSQFAVVSGGALQGHFRDHRRFIRRGRARTQRTHYGEILNFLYLAMHFAFSYYSDAGNGAESLIDVMRFLAT